MSQDGLPTFICIGAMKCGTTSLHHYLDAHPQICMSSPKEPNFFSTEYGRDLKWYRQCFSSASRARGESSANYTKCHVFDGVPERMHRLLPDVKLLYLVRDPIERMVSHYTHNCAVTGADHQETRPVNEALLPPSASGYVQTSRYHYQISRYLTHYSLEDILFVESERLRESRSDVLAEVFEFIGVDSTVEEEVFREELHQSTGKTKWSNVGVYLTQNRARKIVKHLAKKIVPDYWVGNVRRMLRENVKKPSISIEVEERVCAYLKHDVEKLRGLTGKDFEAWSL